MRVVTFVLLTISLLSVLSSCSYKQDQLLFQQKRSLDSIGPKTITSLAQYQIQPQDILQIRNLQNASYIIGDAPSGNSTSSTASNISQGQNFHRSTCVPVAVCIFNMNETKVPGAA